ncbi:MAG: hypothetical protein ACKO1M_12570 [Planctomycetota bacterium]
MAGLSGSPGPVLYAFEAVLHRRPDDAAMSGRHLDEWGSWPVLAVSRDALSQPLAIGFDEALERLAGLPRMFVEPDGAFVWTSPAAERPWQVDGNLFERSGRVVLVDLKGSCPPDEFDRLLGAFGWPAEPVILGLVRPAVFLDEATFRRHAAARGAAGDGQTLRPR